jgi:hypothetical protein
MASVFDPLISLARDRLRSDDIASIIADVNAGDPRTTAIVGGIFVESALREAILSRLVTLTPAQQQELFKSKAPLSNFDSMIVIGRAFGIFDSDIKHDLTAIRHLRNAFAHGRRVRTFRQKEVINVIDSLRLLRRVSKREESYRMKFSSIVQLLVIEFLRLADNPQRPDLAITASGRNRRHADDKTP